MFLFKNQTTEAKNEIQAKHKTAMEAFLCEVITKEYKIRKNTKTGRINAKN